MSHDLRQERRLTNKEFSGAMSEAPAKIAAFLNSRAKVCSVPWRGRWLLVILLGCLVTLSCSSGTGDTTLLMAAAVQRPVTLTDAVEHLPAPAWKAIPLSLPYGGTLNVELKVSQGNAVDVFLTTPDQLDKLVKAEMANLKVDGIFVATSVKDLKRTLQLREGGYYLVVCDMSVDVVPSPASDILVRAQLTP
jgi:hypothetical protein